MVTGPIMLAKLKWSRVRYYWNWKWYTCILKSYSNNICFTARKCAPAGKEHSDGVSLSIFWKNKNISIMLRSSFKATPPAKTRKWKNPMMQPNIEEKHYLTTPTHTIFLIIKKNILRAISNSHIILPFSKGQIVISKKRKPQHLSKLLQKICKKCYTCWKVITWWSTSQAAW